MDQDMTTKERMLQSVQDLPDDPSVEDTTEQRRHRLGSGRTLFHWKSTPDPHTLSLVSADGYPLDTGIFEDRGIATAAVID